PGNRTLNETVLGGCLSLVSFDPVPCKPEEQIRGDHTRTTGKRYEPRTEPLSVPSGRLLPVARSGLPRVTVAQRLLRVEGREPRAQVSLSDCGVQRIEVVSHGVSFSSLLFFSPFIKINPAKVGHFSSEIIECRCPHSLSRVSYASEIQ